MCREILPLVIRDIVQLISGKETKGKEVDAKKRNKCCNYTISCISLCIRRQACRRTIVKTYSRLPITNCT